MTDVVYGFAPGAVTLIVCTPGASSFESELATPSMTTFGVPLPPVIESSRRPGFGVFGTTGGLGGGFGAATILGGFAFTVAAFGFTAGFGSTFGVFFASTVGVGFGSTFGSTFGAIAASTLGGCSNLGGVAVIGSFVGDRGSGAT